MVSYFNPANRAKPVATRQSEILESLTFVAMRLVNTQFAAFSTRLIDALLAQSQQSADNKQTNFCFHASTLLKNNGAALAKTLQQELESVLRRENDAVEHGFQREMAKNEGELSLVPYEEMDSKVMLGTVARPFEQKYADQLTALNIRLAFLLERNAIPTSRNPYRPEVLITALYSAWQQFDTGSENHSLILPFLQPELVFDFAPVYQALNESLMGRGILPGSVDAYRIKKTDKPDGNRAGGNLSGGQLKQQLQQWLEPESVAGFGGGGFGGNGTGSAFGGNGGGGFAAPGFAPNPAQLRGFLNELQQRIAAASSAAKLNDSKPPHNVVYLQKIKQMAPKGSLSPVDEKAIDLLTKIFETVFIDHAIPQEIKSLVGLLQVPVLNEALQDKDFFYQESHPARRLIELLTQMSLEWEKGPSQQDPLFQVLKQNVALLQKKSSAEKNLFADVVQELEKKLQEEQLVTEQAIAEPIAQALKQEKTIQAAKTAKNEVAMRIGTGEVVAFVETFLEDKWVSVLTIAYSVQDEKPEVVKNAVKTMDDLIWSVKPKITAEERKEFIAKLPSLLAMLNKWLNVIKWNDADRLQFFAELAETHASIVRAPLELSPERQMQIAMEVAQKAAERRLARQANAQPEPEIDESVTTVENLQRGMWLDFLGGDGTHRKVKLAWISPMRSLYIFSSHGRKESFSLSNEQLAESFRSQQVQVLRVGGGDGKHDLVANALSHAVASHA